jgi:hypothetical protein
MKKENRGRRPAKDYPLKTDKIYTFDESEEGKIRYRARENGWLISCKKDKQGKIVVIRLK